MSSAASQTTSTSTPKIARSSKKPNVKSVKKSAISTHPPTSVMVNDAIKALKEKGGSSLLAIKKYISATYKVDGKKASPFIKKYLKTAADKGELTRTKGKGASGSFKLHSITSEERVIPSAKKSMSVVKLKKPKSAKRAKSPSKSKTRKQKSTQAKKVSRKPKAKNVTKKSVVNK